MRAISIKIIALVALLCSQSVVAETYTFQGENHTTFSSLYDGTMSVSGTLETSGPLPASAVNFDITPLLVSWEFTDGVATISSAGGGTLATIGLLVSPRVTTDGTGDIIGAVITARNLPLGMMTGDSNDVIIIVSSVGSSIVAGASGATCLTDLCISYGDGPDGSGSSITAGVWTTVPPVPMSDPTVVPTLSSLGLLWMTLGLMLVGGRRLRRKAA